jgi:hypothetical protein
MGTIKRGLLGGFSGKVANIVGGSWKGIAYMRSLPLSVANPKTAAQTSQRTAFAGIVAVATFYLTFLVKPLWDRFASQMSGYNDFVRTNIACFVEGEFENWNDFKIAQGKLGVSAITAVDTVPGGDSMEIQWDNAAVVTNTALTDTAFAAAYSHTTKMWAIGQTEKTRGGESIKVYFPANLLVGEEVTCYLAFKNIRGDQVSNTSVYEAVAM